MTPEEISIALSFQHVSCLPGTWEKRFLKQTYYRAKDEPEKPITDKQRYWIIQLMYKFRRQIPNTYNKYKHLYEEQGR